jgi:hypothetical protein
MITLFSEPPLGNRAPSTLVVSLLLHGAVLSSVTATVLHDQPVYTRYPRSFYSLRVLELQKQDSQLQRSVGSGILYPGPRSVLSAPAADQAAAQGSEAPAPSHALTPLRPAPQTLIQPDLPIDKILPEKLAVPTVTVWSPEVVLAKKIVPPAPHPPAKADVRPVPEIPNKAENLADARIAPMESVTQKLAVQPSTVSPVVVHSLEPANKVPETTAKSATPPTPARVLSLSSVHVPDGPIALPQVNEIAAKPATTTTLNPGKSKDIVSAGKAPTASTATGTGSLSKPANGAGPTPAKADGKSPVTAKSEPLTPPNPLARENNSGRGIPTADHPNKPVVLGSVMVANAQTAQPGANFGAMHGSDSGSQSGSSLAPANLIHLPKDGHFGVVVVGESIVDRYPETAELWNGRLAATVYVRVGKGKSWILQYASIHDGDAASSGGKLEAPWPYEIVLPNIDPRDLDSDALIVHGFVSSDGHFEKLRVAFPPQFVQEPMLVNVLSQWQFRPGVQNGQNTRVEILLIIPEVTEN